MSQKQYEYTLDDLKEIKLAFEDVIADHETCDASTLIVIKGVIKLLEDPINAYLERVPDKERTVLIYEHVHRFIIAFIDEEINSLKNLIKKEDDLYKFNLFLIWFNGVYELRKRLNRKVEYLGK